MSTLRETIEGIVNGRYDYSTNWAVYAKTPFTYDSEAEIGNTQWDNGGYSEEYKYFANFETIMDDIAEYTGENYPVESDIFSSREVAEYVIDEILE